MKPLFPALPLFLGMLCFTASGADAANMMPNANAPATPIVVKADRLDRMDVVFNHPAHKGIACDTCHHKPRCAVCHRAAADHKTGFASCAQPGCHRPDGRSSDPQSRFMAFHAQESTRSCLGCHLKEAPKHPSLDGCSPCHTPASVAPKK